MKYLLALAALLSLPLPAHAESEGLRLVPVSDDFLLRNAVAGAEMVREKVAELRYRAACDCVAAPSADRDYYLALSFGDGRASEGGSLQRRAFDFRFGVPVGEGLRVDFVHENEGHPLNNHRDGFAVQAVAGKMLSRNVRVEAGVGPYFSMNTTTKDGTEYDDKHLGVLASAAALYYLNGLSPGLHLRVQYNHVLMPGAMSTDAVLVGVGKDFDHEKPGSGVGEEPTQFLLLGGDGKTNHGGTPASKGMWLEARRAGSDAVSYSVSVLHEGDDGRVDRTGVAAQAWYTAPMTDKLRFSAGAGPYLAHDPRAEHAVELHGLISLQVERDIGRKENGVSVVFRFSRVVSSDNNDKDLGFIGIAKKL